MDKKSKIPDKTRSSRLSDFFEISAYFTSDGGFNEDSLRMTIRDTVNILSKKDEGSVTEALLAYLSEITEKMLDKKFNDQAALVLNAALEELESLGIKDLSLPASLVRTIMTSSAKRKKSEDKMKSYSEMRRKIFNAAIAVFSKKGYHPATIDEIASLSGVGKGTVYRNFKSKEDLLDQLLIDKYKEIIDSIGQTFAKEGDILDHIREMIENWIDFIEKNPVVYRLIQDQAITQKISDGKMFYNYFVTHLPLIKDHIVSFNNGKKLKPLNYYTVYYGILGFIDGVVHKWFRNGMSYPLKKEIPIILEVLFNGFVSENKAEKRFYED